MKKTLILTLVLSLLTIPAVGQERAFARDSIDAVVTRNPHAANAQDATTASIAGSAGMHEGAAVANAHGTFTATLTAADGRVKWTETFSNVVTTVGKNLALDTYLAGSAYTVTGPYMGLISSVSWSAVAASDTMSSHAGWTEAGATNAPTYSGTRKTAAWNAASGGSKALSAGLTFSFTGSGTVKGVFLVYGTGAVNTLDRTKR